MDAAVHVDPRIELISIIFHLAGSTEYTSFDTPYRRAVDAHFAPLSDHEAVTATRELRAHFQISHNAPVSLAVYLDRDCFEPLVALDAAKADLDVRWRDVPLSDYLAKVRRFAEESQFRAFFAGQQSYIAAVEARFAQTIAEHRVLPWFESLLGQPAATTFVLVPGLLTGDWNYEAMAHDGHGQKVYEVVELERVDVNGVPMPTGLTTTLIVHEIAHSYVNPLIDRHRDELSSARTIYEKLRRPLEQQSYRSWVVMVEESLVRAITLLFVIDRQGRQPAAAAVVGEEKRGFLWMPRLVELLAQLRFEANGKLDLEAAMPRLKAFFDDVASRLQRASLP
jgi:hypothetical protein